MRTRYNDPKEHLDPNNRRDGRKPASLLDLGITRNLRAFHFRWAVSP